MKNKDNGDLVPILPGSKIKVRRSSAQMPSLDTRVRNLAITPEVEAAIGEITEAGLGFYSTAQGRADFMRRCIVEVCQAMVNKPCFTWPWVVDIRPETREEIDARLRLIRAEVAQAHQTEGGAS